MWATQKPRNPDGAEDDDDDDDDDERSTLEDLSRAQKTVNIRGFLSLFPRSLALFVRAYTNMCCKSTTPHGLFVVTPGACRYK